MAESNKPVSIDKEAMLIVEQEWSRIRRAEDRAGLASAIGATSLELGGGSGLTAVVSSLATAFGNPLTEEIECFSNVISVTAGLVGVLGLAAGVTALSVARRYRQSVK